MRLLLLAMLSFLSCANTIYAQAKRTVTGVVRNAEGAALTGATVNEKGTRNNVVTNENGEFSISVSSNATLVITYAGFSAQEVAASGTDPLTVTMQPNGSAMTEVVVTGFGIRRETRKLSYSVQEVKGEELARANTPNIVNALQGKVAGVFINQGNGGPMSSSRIRIRGNASLSGNTQPLVVIDGVIIEPSTTGGDSWGNANDFGNQMKNLNPDDYESLTVLKGSAASALYGSQAQNGVLVITTKKGKARKGVGVNFSQTFTVDRVFKSIDVQNEFGAGIRPTFGKVPVTPGSTDSVFAVDAANRVWSFGPRFRGQQVRDIDGRMITWDPKPNNLIDAFQDAHFRNSYISLEGASDRGSYRFSYTNTANSYVTPETDFKRDNFGIRVSQRLHKFLNIDASINYSVSKSKNPLAQGSTNNPLFSLVYFNPRNFDTKYWMENYLDSAGGVNRNNPYGLANVFFYQKYRRDVQTEKTLLANIDLTSNITSWLQLLVRANLNDRTTDFESKVWGQGVNFAGGSYSLRNSVGRNSRIQVLLNGNKELNDNFSLTFGAGGETQRYRPTTFTSVNTTDGLKVPAQFTLSNSVGPLNGNGGVSEAGRRLDALYAYGDVTYKNMLTFNFSARTDWSSTLLYPRDGHGEPNYFYPSVGLAWVFTELTRNSQKFDFLSFGKVRASYAFTGKGVNPWETSRGYYSFLGNYNTGGTTLTPRYGFDGSTLGFQDIRSELTREFEFGADLRFFKNRLGIDASYYKKNTTNQLLPLTVPIESGVSSRLINSGNIQNQGIEVLLTATPVRTKNMEWTTGFNFARNRNKIIELAPGVTSIDLDLAFGADMASVARAGKDYGTIVTGYAYATYQKLDATGKPIDHPNNGQKMLAQNGRFFRSSEVGQGQKELGTMMERFTLSNIQNLRYKNFNFGFQIDSKFGGMMASATHQYGSTNGALKSTLFGRSAEFGGVTRRTYNATTGAVTGTFDDGIIPDGVFADGITIRAPNGQTHNVGGMTYAEAVSKGIVEPLEARIYYARLTQWSTGIREYSTFENSWVALREVSVGYTLPQSLAAKLRFNSMRLNLVGRNLGYFYTTTKDGIHPEGGLLSNRAGTFAEYGGVPYIRSVGVTLNAGF